MIIKEFFALLGMKTDEASFKRADAALGSINVGLLAVASAAVAGISAIVKTTASYEGLKSALITATKSTAGAEAAFLDLQTFADATPYSLEEATKAYIRMSSAGLKPSIEALTDFGDIASAIPGKSILDFVEAVADGTQGQGRRLKEFGISLHKQGSQVALTFGKTTKTVKNDADSIEQAIRDISKANFGGSMQRASETLAGQWSTLKDKASGLAFDIGEGGLLPALKGGVVWLTKVLVAVKPVAKAIGSTLNLAVKTVSRAFAPLGLVLEWVSKKLSGLSGSLANGVIIFAVNTLAGAFVLLGINAVRAATATLLGWIAAAAPLIAMAAIVGALLLLLEDVWVWFNGGESVIGDLLGTWDEFWTKMTTPLASDPDWLFAIKTALATAKELLAILDRLTPKKIIAQVTGQVDKFNDTLGDINKNINATAKENRLKSGKFNKQDIFGAVQATTDQANRESAEPIIKAYIQDKLSGFTQGAISGTSVAGANAVTNNKSSTATNSTTHIASPNITVEHKDDTSTGIAIVDALLSLRDAVP